MAMKNCYLIVLFAVLFVSYVEVDGKKRNQKCTLDPVKGPCMGYFIRYYYDIETSECKTFIYGGCMGNENNFFTEVHCEEECP
ncbi:PI-actitoxin-Aeq3a-like [Glandiceps talaboti]